MLKWTIEAASGIAAQAPLAMPESGPHEDFRDKILLAKAQRRAENQAHRPKSPVSLP